MIARESLPLVILEVIDNLSSLFASGSINGSDLAILKDHINSLQQVDTVRANLLDPASVTVDVTPPEPSE